MSSCGQQVRALARAVVLERESRQPRWANPQGSGPLADSDRSPYPEIAMATGGNEIAMRPEPFWLPLSRADALLGSWSRRLVKVVAGSNVAFTFGEGEVLKPAHRVIFKDPSGHAS